MRHVLTDDSSAVAKNFFTDLVWLSLSGAPREEVEAKDSVGVGTTMCDGTDAE